MNSIDLTGWGLTARFAQEATLYDAPLVLGRVTEQHRQLYTVVTDAGFADTSVSGSFAYHAADGTAFPAVGDWVMLEPQTGASVIHHILTRQSLFVRKAAGMEHAAQIVAANIDLVFICMALNEDYNLRRLERYLSIAWDSGATPVVILTKADLCDDAAEKCRQASDAAPGVDVVVCAALVQDGYASVLPYVQPGKTIAFIGSSGVGKSTLINRLAGTEALATGDIRDDGKGRHTTTHRQLLQLPDDAVVIDTPGMRELGAMGADTAKAFADIEALGAQCKFQDCTHTVEPGCAVRAAVENGSLDAARLENYTKLLAEANYSGLSSRQIEEEKLQRMFGGKGEYKQAMRTIHQKKHRG